MTKIFVGRFTISRSELVSKHFLHNQEMTAKQVTAVELSVYIHVCTDGGLNLGSFTPENIFEMVTLVILYFSLGGYMVILTSPNDKLL